MIICRRIGINARRLREAASLSLDAVAGRGRLSRSRVVQIERGDVIANPEELAKIASVLGASVAALFDGISWDQNQMRFDIN
jgi:transcriptional regulator with XRE-family HTH domain